jgi:clan AA aspartic protease
MDHVHQSSVAGGEGEDPSHVVDTGATYSVIPARVATKLGSRQPRRSVRVRLADGRRIRLGVDVAVVRVDGPEAPVTILIGKVDEPILGAEALEALGLVVDSRRKRLLPSRPYAVRLGGYR